MTYEAVGETHAPKIRVLDHMRGVLRLKHLSRRTEEAYRSGVKRCIVFHHQRHPKDMGAPEIRAFLTSLVVEGTVAASTQNNALQAQLSACSPGIIFPSQRGALSEGFRE